MIRKASVSDAAALPSFSNLRFFLTTFSLSHIQSNNSAHEHDFADLSCVINPNKASIPFSTTAFYS